MRASAIRARPAETSASATSDAQVSSVAAARIPRPKIRAFATSGISGFAMPARSRNRNTGAGSAAVAVRQMISHWRKSGARGAGSAAGIYVAVYKRTSFTGEHLLTPSEARRYTCAAITLRSSRLPTSDRRYPGLSDSNGGSGKAKWVEGTYARSIAKAPERDYPFDTSGGAPVEPIYAPEDLNGWDYMSQL